MQNNQIIKTTTSNNELLLSKERKIFRNIYNKILNKIDELSKQTDYGDLRFIVHSSGLETDFSELKNPVAFVDSIKKVKYQLKKHNKGFNRYLTKIRTGNKSDKQNKKALANINKLFNARSNAIKLVDDHSLMILEGKPKAAEGEPEPKPQPSKAKAKLIKSPLELLEEFINENKNVGKI